MSGESKRSKKPIGEYLVAEGLITQAELLEALASRMVIDGRRERLGETLMRLGFVSEDDIARIVATQFGLEFAGGEIPSPHVGANNIVPETLARRHQIVPLWLEPDGALVVLCVDPTDIVAMDDVRLAAGARGVRPIVTSSDKLKQALSIVYTAEGSTGHLLQMLAEDDDEPEEDLQAVDADAPVIRLAETIIHDALHGNASDIHVEPSKTGTRVRYRIDGVLHEIMEVPRNVHNALVSRLKLIAGMDIAERRRPQDGRSTYRAAGAEVDLRVSTLPLMHGEKVVMRLLRKGAEQLLLEDVGLSEEQHALVLSHIERPQGLCLLTGPTGAGKTSTLYAFLAHLADEERNLVTIEDPIEYELAGVNQSQVNPRIDYTFGNALRTVLRQDPDVVMVGEIRDMETAELAMQASLTGHMVFSTLHTNDAVGAVTRLADLGIPNYLIAASLTMVVAQRLARRVCNSCAEPVEPTAIQVERLALTPEEVAAGRWRRGRGCSTCSHTGYRGRIGLFEVLTVDRGVKNALMTSGDETQIEAAARRNGLKSLREDGIAKAMLGLTSLDEVLRVTPTDLRDTEDGAAHAAAEAEAPPPPPAEPAPAPAPAERRTRNGGGIARILLADADSTARHELAAVLREHSYEVIEAAAGTEALDVATAAHPDVALIARDLGDLDGYAVTSELRSRAVTLDLPVMILDSDGSADEYLEALRAGADGNVRRRGGAGEVLSRLDELLTPERSVDGP